MEYMQYVVPMHTKYDSRGFVAILRMFGFAQRPFPRPPINPLGSDYSNILLWLPDYMWKHQEKYTRKLYGRIKENFAMLCL